MCLRACVRVGSSVGWRGESCAFAQSPRHSCQLETGVGFLWLKRFVPSILHILRVIFIVCFHLLLPFSVTFMYLRDGLSVSQVTRILLSFILFVLLYMCVCSQASPSGLLEPLAQFDHVWMFGDFNFQVINGFPLTYIHALNHIHTHLHTIIEIYLHTIIVTPCVGYQSMS